MVCWFAGETVFGDLRFGRWDLVMRMNKGIAVRNRWPRKRATLALTLALAGVFVAWQVEAAVLEGVEAQTGITNRVEGVGGTAQLDPLAGWLEGAPTLGGQDDPIRPSSDREVERAELQIFLTDPVLAGAAAGLLVLGLSSLVLGIRAWRHAHE